jgi:hypothetical protein
MKIDELVDLIGTELAATYFNQLIKTEIPDTIEKIESTNSIQPYIGNIPHDAPVKSVIHVVKEMAERTLEMGEGDYKGKFSLEVVTRIDKLESPHFLHVRFFTYDKDG